MKKVNQISVIMLAILWCGTSFSNQCGLIFSKDYKNEALENQNDPRDPNGFDRFRIFGSGRDSHEVKTYEAFSSALYKPGGVLERLQIPGTFQVVEFMRGQDLNAVAKAGTGGYPVTHYLDGNEIVKAYYDQNSLIYEVVYPGAKVQHAFYRDDNPIQQQFSILLHVIGHNHFAHSSFLKGYREAHGPHESLKLDELLNNLYKTENRDEVSRWYLFLKSLLPLQDFYTANYQRVEEFEPKNPHQMYMDYQRRVDLGQDITAHHPLSPTENVLQAFTANIPPHAMPWKKQIAEQMVKLTSYQTALVHTQVMNEGWATFMQELLPKYMKEFNSFEYWLGSERLMNSGNQPNLRDPYWLGVHAWRHLYKRFRERPEIKSLKDEEAIDREFIKYADKIISSVDDFDFLRMALDSHWISKYNLAIVRVDEEVTAEEFSKMPPQPRQDYVPWKIESRDANRVVEKIISDTVYGKYRFRPRVKLVDFHRKGSGDVELVLDDEIGRTVPLDPESIGPTLYAYAQILEKPISLEATLLAEGLLGFDSQKLMGSKEEAVDYLRSKGYLESIADLRRLLDDDPGKVAIRARIVVAPNGEIKVYRISKDKVESFDVDLTEELGQYLDRHLLDLYLEDSTKVDWLFENNPRLKIATEEAIGKTLDRADISGFVDHVPSVSKALMELKSILSRRTLRSLELAMSGKGGLVRQNGQLYLKALPSVPTLSYDTSYIQKIFDGDVVDATTFTSQTSKFFTIVGPDDKNNGNVNPIGGGEGDHVWGPNPKGGEGAGNRRPGNGEPQDGDPMGNKPGQDVANDPSWVPIPEELYAKVLGEKLKLPNLNPKPGPAKKNKKVQRGKRNQRTGVALYNDILINALEKGISGQVHEGKEPTEDLVDTLDTGLSLMNPQRDWVVKGQKIMPKPDTNAVVTFVLDASGSTAQFFNIFKKLVFDVKTLIKHNYKDVAFRFVLFDWDAREAKNEEEFFKMALGGATRYVKGIEKVREIQEENYPRSDWDRFSIFLGDLEDYDSNIMPSFRELIDESEYVGVVRGSMMERMPLANDVEALSKESDYFGFLDLRNQKTYTIDQIRELFKNKEE